MLRRLAALLLVAALGAPGITLCPSGACPVAQRAAHDCCKKGPGLKSLDCCPNAAAAASLPWLATTHGERSASSAAALACTGSVVVAASTRLLSTGTSATAHGPAPPPTLLRQHTSLLL